MKFVFFILMFSVFFTSGCNASLEKRILNNISEIREFVLYADNEEMSVSLVCGKREKEYKLDGKVNKLIPFGVITIQLDEVDCDKEIDASFILFVGTKKYSGHFFINPYDNTLVYDINDIVDKTQNVYIDVSINGKKTNFKMGRVDKDWCVDVYDCVGIFVNEYKSELKDIIKNEFEYEVYIKILNDQDQYENDYYYYVSLIVVNDKSINVIISPINGEILAKDLSGL